MWDKRKVLLAPETIPQVIGRSQIEVIVDYQAHDLQLLIKPEAERFRKPCITSNVDQKKSKYPTPLVAVVRLHFPVCLVFLRFSITTDIDVQKSPKICLNTFLIHKSVQTYFLGFLHTMITNYILRTPRQKCAKIPKNMFEDFDSRNSVQTYFLGFLHIWK